MQRFCTGLSAAAGFNRGADVQVQSRKGAQVQRCRDKGAVLIMRFSRGDCAGAGAEDINISVMYPEHYPKMVLNIRRANI